MFYSAYAIVALVIFAFLMIASIAIGYRFGMTKVESAGFNITEGAVFTLMALLIAFTFGSANQRFDMRRAMITEETNAIGTAYLRLDVLQEKDRNLLRKDFREYITARLAIYQAIPDFQAVERELQKSKEIQAKLWLDAIAACKDVSIPILPMLILPSINTMFDIANTRSSYTYLHPHILVFTLLILVALLSSFLTGYGISGKGTWTSLHVIAFALIITLTIYIILDLEYPRLGIIKESAFDQQLIELKETMSKNDGK